MGGTDHRLPARQNEGDGEAPRPLRAFRLMEEMDPPHKPRDRGARSQEPQDSVEDTSALRAPVEDASVLRAPVDDASALRVPVEDTPTTPDPPGYAVLSVTPAGEGEVVAVVLAQPASEGKKPLRVRLYLLTEQYAALAVKPGEITPEEADTLLAAGKLCAAVRRGMGLLQYGSTSAQRLAYKLTAKGVEREVAQAAAAYLSERGYIREDDTAARRAEQDLRKGWGLHRIREDLRAQGYAPHVLQETLEALADTDWAESCAAVIRKKYGSIPGDRAARQKMIAALMRLGYEADEVREAMRRVLR